MLSNVTQGVKKLFHFSMHFKAFCVIGRLGKILLIYHRHKAMIHTVILVRILGINAKINKWGNCTLGNKK